MPFALKSGSATACHRSSFVRMDVYHEKKKMEYDPENDDPELLPYSV